MLTSGIAILLIYFADGQLVETWPISPNVCLSILATITGLMLRSAFQAGAEAHWWALLVARPRGVSLRTLHGAWELSHGAMARFKLGGQGGTQPILRSAGIFLILLAGNGPLLQRAVSIDLIEIHQPIKLDLPIRREPMWNLTVLPVTYFGQQWSMPPYQYEFAEVVSELSQRRPIRLRNHAEGCPKDSRCSANVTVASFSRACAKTHVPIAGVPTLPQFRLVIGDGELSSLQVDCVETGPRYENYTDDESYCRHLNLQYQLGWQSLQIDADEPITGGLPWIDTNMPPFGLNYTSYYQEGIDGSGMITVQRCNFSTAFVDIPIEITTGMTVTMVPGQGDLLALLNNGTESIPAIAPIYYWYEGHDNLGGIRQAMSDLYGGYAFFDDSEISQAWRGGGPRQSINLTSLKQIRQQNEDFNYHSVAFNDPLANFTETLHELSLRYATQMVPSTPERLLEMDDFMDDTYGPGIDRPDHQRDAISRMKTQPSPRQTVTGVEARSVNIYRVDYIFAAVAVSITTLTTVLVALLFTGWRQLGRHFSMSPVELAKAFDAPLLADVGSNATSDEIANRAGNLRLRYGEVDEGRYLLGSQAKTCSAPEDGSDTQAALNEAGDRLSRRLAIGKAEVVSTPIVGKTYL